MKSLLITTFVLTLGLVAYAQTSSAPAAKTDCKEQHIDKKAGKVMAKAAAGNEAQTSTAAATCPQSPDPPPHATPAVTGPTPTAALSAATVAPPVDHSQLNITISPSSSQESLGAAARRIRAKKAAEEASKTQ